MDSILFSIDNRIDFADSIISQYTHYHQRANLAPNPNYKPIQLGSVDKAKFSDGELCVDFKETVRGKRVYLLSSPNTSDEIIKLTLAIDAAKRAAASEVIVILPYYPYARQDKKDQDRGPIGAKVMAKILESSGATAIITYELHADQIQGFFEIPVTHIEGKTVFAEDISKIANESTVLCAPDAGSGKRLKRMKEQIYNFYGIDLPIVMMDKTRKRANEINTMVIIGDVTGKDVIIVDDLIDTAGTLCKAVDVLLDNGAKSVRAYISHPVLSGKAYENIANSNLTSLVVSNSLAIKTREEIGTENEKAADIIRVVSATRSIIVAMYAINLGYSYESLKNYNNK
jgi:ribose-phosphate pyrophosphokinase